MDPQRHAQLSARRHGGEPDDYVELHSFVDATKEICSDNRHRIFHTLWAVRRVIIPIVGPLITAGGKSVRTKTVLEHDHILADFSRRFIPTLGDFVDAIADDGDERERFAEIHGAYRGDDEVVGLLLSPYFITGEVKALLVTHNTWFLGEIVPRLLGRSPRLAVRGVPPGELFERMEFRMWMDNGRALPASSPEHRFGRQEQPRGLHHP